MQFAEFLLQNWNLQWTSHFHHFRSLYRTFWSCIFVFATGSRNHVDDVSGIGAPVKKSPAFDFSSWGDSPQKKHLGITGWWLSHPSEKYEFVSIIRNIWKKICQTTNQDNVWFIRSCLESILLKLYKIIGFTYVHVPWFRQFRPAWRRVKHRRHEDF